MNTNWIDQVLGHQLINSRDAYSLPTDEELQEAYINAYPQIQITPQTITKNPEPQQPTQENFEVIETRTLEEAKQALAEEKAKAEANLAGWQRAQADYINYKRRSEQEKEEISQFANSILVLNLLPILDDWERALASIPEDQASLSWVEGVRLIERKLRGILEAQGLSPIEAVGEPFDPHLHEAVRRDKGEEGAIIEEVQKGYKFYDRVIRPSKVVVGNGEDEVEPNQGKTSVREEE
jgi:molecular chaperone GrpE